MRTNIVIDDALMEKAMRLTGITTKREVVEEALRTLIRQNEQKSRPAYTVNASEQPAE